MIGSLQREDGKIPDEDQETEKYRLGLMRQQLLKDVLLVGALRKLTDPLLRLSKKIKNREWVHSRFQGLQQR